MSTTTCPGCKASKYNNPQLKLLVNLCGHFLCESCVEIMFVRGSGMCSECKTPLRRNNFREQLFESSTVEKEVDIRKRILKDFNKRQEDFPSLDEYNDYLEFVEDIIFNLANNIDADETKRKVEEYKAANKDKIKRIKARSKNIDLEELEMQILEEEEFRKRNKESDNVILEKQKMQRQIKEKLIDDLMTSSASANSIVAQHASLINSESGERKAAGDLQHAKKESTIDSMGRSFIKYASLRDKAKSSGSTISMDLLPEVTATPFVYREHYEDSLGPALPENVERHVALIKNTLRISLDENLLKAGFSHTDWTNILLKKTYNGLFL